MLCAFMDAYPSKSRKRAIIIFYTFNLTSLIVLQIAVQLNAIPTKYLKDFSINAVGYKISGFYSMMALNLNLITFAIIMPLTPAGELVYHVANFIMVIIILILVKL